MSDIAPGASVQVRAVINYYRYFSTSSWGDADHSVGDDYYFAFAPGGSYYEPRTTNVDKTGFVIVVAYSEPTDDLDNDGQTVSQGDSEICGDGIDQDCDGEDEPCPVTVTSAGQVWMDRNLGASRQATSYDDPQVFGDLYQWGRLKDGHEKRTSETTSTRSNLDVPGHGDFITVAYPYSDWREPENDSLWQGESGINNPCPSGFRLPTATELQVERASWHPQNSAGAYASPAKFVVGGYRDAETGDVEVAGREGYYWSSTVTDRRFGKRADYLVIRPGNTEMSYVNNQATGQSVRCIQD